MKRVHSSLRVAGPSPGNLRFRKLRDDRTCAPATLHRSEALSGDVGRCMLQVEFAVLELEVAPAAQLPHWNHLRYADRETARYRKNPCVKERMQQRRKSLNDGMEFAC